jgi:hypothetical protein
MSAQDNMNGKQFPVISESESRGNSRPVSHDEFQQLAARGQRYVARTGRQQSTEGLDRDWPNIKDRAFKEAQASWGGATINSHSGEFVNPSHGYALTVRHPGQEQIRLPENVNHEQFGAAMDRARSQYPQLANRNHHLGVFHDDDEKSIDIDPVLVVHRKSTVDSVGAYTRAVGGAYDFKTGDGHFPPHVRGPGGSKS